MTGLTSNQLYPQARVSAVALCSKHSFSKQLQPSITLIKGQGVAQDAHAGTTVKHRSRVAKDPSQPNLRQVHLIHGELHDELNRHGFHVKAADMGENITTLGLPLLQLPRHTILRLGDEATLEVTGLRNPCQQLDDFQSGLLAAVLDKDKDGKLIRKAGIMAIVLASGEVRPGDAIKVILPTPPFKPLERV